MSEKQVVIEGDVTMVATKGMSVLGKTLGAEETVRTALRFREISPINDWPLGAKVRVTVELVE